MKALFLDIDGVVATPSAHWNIVPEKVSLVRKICKETDAKIIISSSWRKDNVEHTKEAFRRQLHKMFKQYPDVEWFVENIYDVTPDLQLRRGDDIQRYIEEHQIDNYVIVDDDSDMLDNQLYHFVQTDWGIGLTEREVEIIIKVINDEYIFNLQGLNNVIRYEYRKDLDNLPNRFNEILQYNDLNRVLE